MSSSSEDQNADAVSRAEEDQEVEKLAQEMPHAAVAVMEFVSGMGNANGSEITYITSKDALMWGALACIIAEVNLSEALTKFRITQAVYNALKDVTISRRPSLPLSSLRPVDLRIQHDYVFAFSLASAIATELCDGVYVSELDYYLQSLMDDGYNFCFENDLISDPVIETGLAVAGSAFAILGFVPFKIVKRTKKGQVVYKKLQAALWKYERKRTTGGSETQLTFAVLKIAQALKVALVQGYHELASEPGEESEL